MKTRILMFAQNRSKHAKIL